MTPLPLDKTTVLNRDNGIQGELAELRKLAQIPFGEFSDGVGFKLAQFHLHRAVEGVFHIGSHILSRIPGAAAVDWRRRCGVWWPLHERLCAVSEANQTSSGWNNAIICRRFVSEHENESTFRVVF